MKRKYSFLLFRLLPDFRILRKYKTQPGENEPVDREKFLRMFRVVLFNNSIVAFIVGNVAYLGATYLHSKKIVCILIFE